MKNSKILRWIIPIIAGLILVGAPVATFAGDDDDDAREEQYQRPDRGMHPMPGRPDQMGPQTCPMSRSCDRPSRYESMCDSKSAASCDMQRHCRPARCRYPAVCILGTIAIVMLIVHILLATWIYRDIRKRGEGSGVFIVLALLIGVPGAALYLLARIGERKTS